MVGTDFIFVQEAALIWPAEPRQSTSNQKERLFKPDGCTLTTHKDQL